MLCAVIGNKESFDTLRALDSFNEAFVKYLHRV
jgi:hypothetical protein